MMYHVYVLPPSLELPDFWQLSPGQHRCCSGRENNDTHNWDRYYFGASLTVAQQAEEIVNTRRDLPLIIQTIDGRSCLVRVESIGTFDKGRKTLAPLTKVGVRPRSAMRVT